MSTSRALILLPLLAGCGSHPAEPDPVIERPETAIDATFLIGAWAPYPDVGAIDLKVDGLVADGMQEDEAIMACYQARFLFESMDSCEFGLSVQGEMEGTKMQWSADSVSPHQLLVQLSSSGAAMPPLSVTREGEFIDIKGDPAIAGRWLRIERGDQAEREDAATGQLAIQHINQRETLKLARVEMEENLQQREESLEVMVQMVKTICESEELTGDTGRKRPISNESYNSLKQSMPVQEAVLMAMPVPNAPKSPVLPKHVGQTQGFDEDWLAGVWTFKSDEVDWDLILPQAVPEESLPEFKATFETLRRTFSIRGQYRNTLGWPEIREDMGGYYCLTPGAGAWSWVTILRQHGSPDVGIQREEVGTFAAYRVGDVLWLEEGQGAFFPYIKRVP